MRIGFERDTGHVYEGTGAPQFAVWPPPLLSQAKLVESPDDGRSPALGLNADPFAWVFREERFDPVSRVRRGRLFQSDGTAQPNQVLTAGHPLIENATVSVAGTSRKRSVFTYMPCQALLNRPGGALGALLLIGQERGATLWRVIQAELALDDDVVVTLKAKSAFGVLPDVDWGTVPQAHRPQVRAALERVLDSAFRETPVSVIDQCRNAAAVVLSSWLVTQGHSDMAGKDLAALAKALEQRSDPLLCAAWLARTIARLHVRGKSNEQQTKSLRLPTEEDAELSLHGLGFLLRDVGWAAA